MLLSVLKEVVWKVYQDGKPRADNQKLSEADITQMCRMAAANNFRQQYLFGQKVIPGRKVLALPEEPETYFVSPLLSIKRFPLSDPNALGKRRADMADYDLFRLPKNAHFTNLYLVNNECSGEEIGTISQVKNGEEKFYAGKSKYKKFRFYAVTGRGIDAYNVPVCVKFVDVETTYDSDDADISLDICYDILTEVLSVIFKVEDATGEMQIKAKEEMKKREEIK